MNEAVYREILMYIGIISLSAITGIFSVFAFEAIMTGVRRLKRIYADRRRFRKKPMAHGKWLNIDGDYTFAACSICKEEYEVATEEEAEKALWGAFLSAYRYCPNCGAKMDEDG